MRKALLLFVCITSATLVINAQLTSKPPLRFIAGINFQNINGKYSNGVDLNNDPITGFHIGLNAEFQLTKEIYIRPGLVYNQKGTRWLSNPDISEKVNYIDLPVPLIYEPQLGNGNLLLGFGPYIGFGVGGVYKEDNAEIAVKFRNTYSTFPTVREFKRLDGGAVLLAGYEFKKRYSLQLDAQLGLVDVNPKDPDSNDQMRLRHTGFGISIGYRL
jgi:hypothetical protein